MTPSHETSANREVRRVPRACRSCRAQKLKCRLSTIPEFAGKCERCVRNSVAHTCIFVPVGAESLHNVTSDMIVPSQSHTVGLYPYEILPASSRSLHYASQTVPVQSNTQYPLSHQGGSMSTQNEAYTQPDLFAYSPQGLPPYPVPLPPYSHPASWPESNQSYHEHVSQGNLVSEFVGGGSTVDYSRSYPPDLPNYGSQQENRPFNNSTNWTNTEDGYLPYNQEGYEYIQYQPQHDSEPKE